MFSTGFSTYRPIEIPKLGQKQKDRAVCFSSVMEVGALQLLQERCILVRVKTLRLTCVPSRSGVVTASSSAHRDREKHVGEERVSVESGSKR